MQAFSSSADLSEVMDSVTQEVLRLIPAHNAAIFQIGEDGSLTLKVHRQSKDAPRDFTYSTSVISKVIAEKKALLMEDASLSEKFAREESIVDHSIRTVMCSPLLYRDELVGVIYLDTHGIVRMFDENALQLLTGISSAAAAAISNSMIVDKVRKQAELLKKVNEQIMLALANAIEERDHYTAGHTWRVTRFSEVIAKKLGWPEDRLTNLRTGGVLHDIGKIGVPDRIILKPDKLTDDEYEIMKTHPKRGSLILKESGCLPEAIPYILYHHERYDGKGYPYQLKAEDIPLEGRILAVADAFDAMTSDRPYRKGMPVERAIAILKENSGTQFDPKIVDIFCAAADEGLVSRIVQDERVFKKSVECPFCSTAVYLEPELDEEEVMVCAICEHKYKITHSEKGMSASRAD
jgi:response regulator RpfG family c-di-GMP phosphodiesterase